MVESIYIFIRKKGPAFTHLSRDTSKIYKCVYDVVLLGDSRIVIAIMYVIIRLDARRVSSFRRIVCVCERLFGLYRCDIVCGVPRICGG